MKHRQFINSALLDNNVGKIELWGDVYENQPTDWFGTPIEGEFITIQKFKDAMESVKNCSSIELHLNSYGGDATVGILIHNLLKDSGKKVTCVIDAIAASAAFTIASACEKVLVYPGSIMMCHEVKSYCWGYYGNTELSELISANSAYNSSAATMYSKKSGLTKQQCLNLMSKTTWMDAEQAIKLGFADEMISTDEEKEQPVELVNKTTMKINGVEHDISGLNIPDDFMQHKKQTTNLGGKSMSNESLKDKLINAISAIFKNDAEEIEEAENAVIEEETENAESVETENDTEVVADDTNGATEEETGTTEETNENNQDVVNSAIEAERKRIQEIEEIANGIDADLVQEAKFTNVCDAKELALRAQQREAQKANDALKEMQQDNTASNVNKVEAVQSAEIVDSEKLTQSEIRDAIKAMRAKINKAKEGK